MRQTARQALLVWLTVAAASCGRPIHNRAVDGGTGGDGGGAGSVAPGKGGTTGGAGTIGGAGTTGSAGTIGAAGTSASAGTTGAAGTSASAGTSGAAGTGGAAIGGTGGGGTGGSVGGSGGSTPVDKKMAGQPCQASSECNSAICADGVCCNTACSGACRSCVLTGSIGNCVAVAPGTVDPRGFCAQEAPTTCGRSGRCDGAGGCQLYPAGAPCSAPSCSENTFTGRGGCDGQGICLVPESVSCAPLGCNVLLARCNRGCPSGDAICPPGYYCDGDESCFAQQDPGAPCGSNHQCKTGTCVSNVCAAPPPAG